MKTMNRYMYILGIFSLLLLFTACSTQVLQVTTNTTQANGRVVMTITDAATNIGTVTSVKMTVDKVALHSDANGWVDVATPKLTYDLVALKASGYQSLLTDLSLSPARYDQIRLDVSGITVTDQNGTHNAKMPSTTLRLNGEIVVLSDKTATASFDFILDQSLYTTMDGKYVFAPFIQLESRTDANADVSASDNVHFSGGTGQASTRVSMDVVGNLVVGGTLPPFLQINDDGTISGTQNALNTNASATPNAINYQDLNSRLQPIGPINPNDLNSRIAP